MVTVKDELTKEFRYRITHAGGSYEMIIYGENQEKADKCARQHLEMMRGCYQKLRLEFIRAEE